MWPSHRATAKKKKKSYLVSTALSNTPTRKSQVWSQFAEHKIFEVYFPHPCFELCRRVSCSYRSLRNIYNIQYSVEVANLHKYEPKFHRFLPSVYSLSLHFSNCPSQICFRMVSILPRNWKYKQETDSLVFLSEQLHNRKRFQVPAP